MPVDFSFLGGDAVARGQRALVDMRTASAQADQARSMADQSASEAKQKTWLNDMTRMAADIFSGSINDDGQVHSGLYWSRIKQAGIPMDLADGLLQHETARRAAAAKISSDNMTVGALGGTPEAPLPAYPQQGQGGPFAGTTGVGDLGKMAAGVPNQRSMPNATQDQSMAPTTGPTLGSFNQAIAPSGKSILEDAPEMPATPDLSKMDPKAIAGFAEDARQRGLYSGDGKVGPEMNGALDKYWKAQWADYVSKKPVLRMKDGQADVLGYTQEMANWKKAGEGFGTKVLGTMGDMYQKTQIDQPGQRNNLVSQGQAIKSTGQELAAVDDARKNGFGNVTRSNFADFNRANSAIGWLASTKRETDELRSAIASGKQLDPDKFSTLLIGLAQAPKAAEGIGTEAAQDAFMSNLRAEKSLGRIAQEAHGIKDLVSLAAKNQIAPQEQAVILDNLSSTLALQLKSGKAANDIDQYKTFGQRAGGAGGGGRPIGATRVHNGQKQTWTGKVWRGE